MSTEVVTSTAGRNQPGAPSFFSAPYRNVGEDERMVSLLAGVGLTLYGLRRGSWCGALSFLTGASLMYRGWSGYCTTYDLLNIDTAAETNERPGVRAQRGRKVVATIHINRDRRDIYDFWRNLENLPRVMRHLKSVTMLTDNRSRWTARAPMGKTLSWEAEIINDRAGEVIAWQSLPGSQVDTAGSVHLNDSAQGSGTELVVSVKYDPPGGQMADRVAHLFGLALEDDLKEDLQQLKRTLEGGEEPAEAPRTTERSETAF